MVTDKVNNRVLIWNSLPSGDGQSADVVLGQPLPTTSSANYGGVGDRSLNSPSTSIIVQNRLFVADSGNHRILVWNAVPTADFATADQVIGQPSLFTNMANNGSISENRLFNPIGISINSIGEMLITDSGNFRILGFTLNE